MADEFELDWKKLQVATTDDAIRREIVKQIIYKRADFIAVGTRIVGIQEVDNLDQKFTFPSEAAVEYPVPEGAGASLSLIEWAEFGWSLGKAEGRFMITDEAVIRGVDRQQWQVSVRRLSEGLAIKKDANILDTLSAGAGNTFAAAATWDTATATQITGDIAKGINYILSAKGVLDTDLKNIVIVLPLKAWTGLYRMMEIEALRVAMIDWIQNSYGISIMPTKHFSSDGLFVLKGADTAVHAVLRAPAGVPLVEQKRHEGIGIEYIVRQFFGTKVVPEEKGVTTSKRIAKITGVA